MKVSVGYVVLREFFTTTNIVQKHWKTLQRLSLYQGGKIYWFLTYLQYQYSWNYYFHILPTCAIDKLTGSVYSVYMTRRCPGGGSCFVMCLDSHVATRPRLEQRTRTPAGPALHTSAHPAADRAPGLAHVLFSVNSPELQRYNCVVGHQELTLLPKHFINLLNLSQNIQDLMLKVFTLLKRKKWNFAEFPGHQMLKFCLA